jgi:hypothetical protein
LPTGREIRKAARQDRKATKQRFWNLRRAFTQVAIQALRDKVWNTTPDATAICIEVMLFTIAEEFAEWPDNWKHKHYFGQPVGTVCSCGICIHGTDRLKVWCRLCGVSIVGIRERQHQPFWNSLVRERGSRTIRDPDQVEVLGLLEMGPPQS